MARVVRPHEAKSLGLPGRVSNEIVSGAHGGSLSCTLRLVEIPVPAPGEPQRGRHCHDGHEECMYVLSGEGVTSSGNGQHPLKAGDTIIVPPGEMHVTRNTGKVPLVMLCFFPRAAIDMRLEGEERK
jgi:mannose-6-phosphate isomerase-like protein (cupin superfamily)